MMNEDAFRTAELSECGSYRYTLVRRWARGRMVCWILLNPSTADAVHDDHTVRKCMGFARHWGFSGIYIVNLFAWRATDPRELGRIERDPFGGPRNDAAILCRTSSAQRVVCGWGDSGGVIARTHASAVVCELRERGITLHCLGTTKSGAPKHPARLGFDTPLEIYAA